MLACSAQPSRLPTRAATAPKRMNCALTIHWICVPEAPRQRITAQASR